MKRFVVGLLGLVLSGCFLFSVPAWAADSSVSATSDGAKLFETHCAGCHINGGNIVRRGKTLKLKALERNQVNTLEAIAALVANGKNNMSAYRDRLTPEEIEMVSTYVLEQAQKNWK